MKWNDFQKNIVSAYHDLRTDVDFSDVTLMCEEDQQIEAHKVILTASSPFFSKILQRNKHPHPMIYMRGLKAKDLVAMVDFIYLGEAKIYQEDLDAFLALADELQVTGLSGLPIPVTEIQQYKNYLKIESLPQEKVTVEAALLNQHPTVLENGIASFKTLVSFDPYTEDLKVKISSMIEEVDDGINNRKCKVCQKTTKSGTQRQAMERHIETHIEGVSHTCNLCQKVSRSSSALWMHLSREHRK